MHKRCGGRTGLLMIAHCVTAITGFCMMHRHRYTAQTEGQHLRNVVRTVRYRGHMRAYRRKEQKMRKISAMYQFSGGADLVHQCVECCNCKRFQRGSRKVYKCMLYGNTNSEASDWNSMSMACKLFNVQYHPLPEVMKMILPDDDGVLDGQMSIFDFLD